MQFMCLAGQSAVPPESTLLAVYSRAGLDKCSLCVLQDSLLCLLEILYCLLVESTAGRESANRQTARAPIYTYRMNMKSLLDKPGLRVRYATSINEHSTQ